LICFPEAWEAMKDRIQKLSGRKEIVRPGIAIEFTGSFQWENSHGQSFILTDILRYKSPPALPEDRKSRKVKMPRSKKVTKEDVDDLSAEDLAEELEEEILDSGMSTIDDEDDVIDSVEENI
jgi:hypothetical protein